MATYVEKLRDPRWQRARLEVLKRDNWTCQKCGSKDKTLHVHHGYYERGKDPWDYYDWTLVTLCDACHRRVGDVLAHVGCNIASVPIKDIEAFASIVSELSFVFLHHERARRSALRDVLGRIESVMGVQLIMPLQDGEPGDGL